MGAAWEVCWAAADAAGKRAMDYARDAGTNPLVIAMLQYLTTEEIAQTPESGLKALVKSKVQEQKTSDAAREMIVYEGARKSLERPKPLLNVRRRRPRRRHV